MSTGYLGREIFKIFFSFFIFRNNMMLYNDIYVRTHIFIFVTEIHIYISIKFKNTYGNKLRNLNFFTNGPLYGNSYILVGNSKFSLEIMSVCLFV